ncbi:MAG: 16S rRNA (cytidine(1402)-2'-O)-methyltransferase [Alphaproteobacteria bacterium]|nr:16S rRNA (cytidine(1402)-2'-O)-methyltransferase [Alphaproteobacteria bacterium]MBU0797651.1 16S rRNA (cytidine(1402)-2'-O)-methyltransferase [Alphaproteobacteria bacterium]MBU0886392.1 16S rRNA (cytidine(1402)-2'-O)-methyltransferase [Alphaproteobacteria bacterium]MBU1813412.1 16S rRNA (cytidine(1402)-2'-O)-methyltransferase [Alphaproteobacteria bacterium]
MTSIDPMTPVKILAPGLYIVATPIGNLGDLTMRGRDILATADAIACEDTRVTGKLLSAFGLKRPLIAYNDHNADKLRPKLMEMIAGGQVVALVSDAGTPLISDPGYKLVRDCVAAGLTVTTAPGASAVLAALVLAGLPTDRFLFAGFLPPKSAARRVALGELTAVPASLVFYESGPRLAASLADMADMLGDREAAVARELTKLFEEVRRGTLDSLAAHYGEAGGPKGEIVVVIGPPLARETAAADLDAALRRALSGNSTRDAAALVAGETGLPRKQVYARALALAQEIKTGDASD